MTARRGRKSKPVFVFVCRRSGHPTAWRFPLGYGKPKAADFTCVVAWECLDGQIARVYATTMFVRFRQTASRLQVGLVEPRRIDGKVRQEHVASVGSIACAPMTIADRIEFWRRLRERLAKLANRIGPAQIKILDAINAKIPMVTLDDQRALQRENAEADEKFWMTLQGLNESTAEDQKGLADMASRAAAGAKVAMDAAAKTAVSAKERLERVAKGEDVSGDLGKPRMPEDFEKELLKAGMTAKDLRRCKKVHAISELGAFDELKLETLASIERAENAAVRKVLSKATIQALRDGRVRP